MVPQLIDVPTDSAARKQRINVEGGDQGEKDICGTNSNTNAYEDVKR